MVGLQLGHHAAVAVAVDRRAGRDRGEQVVGALDAVAGQGPFAGVAQGAQVVVHAASLHGWAAPGRPGGRRAASVGMPACGSPTRRTCGGRPPSSTAWTSRPSWTGTTTAAATSPGLAQRLDYLADLGVTCLWLMPFYPTGDRDDGYDITDFYGVDPRLGTHGDLVEVVRTANDRGHAGHRRPRRQPHLEQAPVVPLGRVVGRTRRYRDFYVWRSDPPPDTSKEVVFPDKENSIWQLSDEDRRVVPAPLLQAAARPQRHRPEGARRDRQGRWASGCELGLSGFRIDAVPFLLETVGHRRGRGAAAAGPARVPARRCARSSAGGPATGVLLGEVNLPHAAAGRSSSAARTATS